MTNTWIVATIIAVIAGVVGFFVVLRGSAFPARALPNSAFAGAAAANLLGISALIGLGAFAAAAAIAIATLGRRGRSDVATALALVLGLALGALFLSRSEEYEPQLFSLLFGEALGVSTTELLPVALLALASVAAIAVLYRPLLYSSVIPDIAEAKGVSSHRMELAFLLVLAAATAHRPGRRRAADLLADDRPARCRPIVHQPPRRRDRAVRDHRADHGLGSDRDLLPDQLAHRILRRHAQRPRLRTRTNLGRMATHPHRTPHQRTRDRARHNLNPRVASPPRRRTRPNSDSCKRPAHRLPPRSRPAAIPAPTRIRVSP